jgi:hypothetical protein
MMRIVFRAGPAAAVLAIGLIVLTPLCGLLFACGCAWPWSGFFFDCNYFDPGAKHRCPWCILPLAAGLPVILGMLAAWTGLGMPSFPKRPDYFARIGAGMLVYLCAALLLGWLAAQHRHYPLGPAGYDAAAAKLRP